MPSLSFILLSYLFSIFFIFIGFVLGVHFHSNFLYMIFLLFKISRFFVLILFSSFADWSSLTETTKTTLLYIVRTCLDIIFHELDLLDTKLQNIYSLERKVGHEMLRKAAGKFLTKCLKSSLFRDILNAIDIPEGYQICLASKLVRSNYCDIRKSALRCMATDNWTEIENTSFQELLQQRLLWDENEAECLAGVSSKYFC